MYQETSADEGDEGRLYVAKYCNMSSYITNKILFQPDTCFFTMISIFHFCFYSLIAGIVGVVRIVSKSVVSKSVFLLFHAAACFFNLKNAPPFASRPK